MMNYDKKSNDYEVKMRSEIGFLPSPEQLAKWLKEERINDKGNQLTFEDKFKDSCKEYEYYCDITNNLIRKILSKDYKYRTVKKIYVMFLKAMIYYIFEDCMENEKDFKSLISLIMNYEIRDFDGFKNSVQSIFEDLEKKNPNSLAVKYFNCFEGSFSREERLYCYNHCLAALWNCYHNHNIKFNDVIDDFENIDDDYFTLSIEETSKMVFSSN